MDNRDRYHYDLMDDADYQYKMYLNNIKQELDSNMKEFIEEYDPYITVKASENCLEELRVRLLETDYDMNNVWTVLKRNGYYYYFPTMYENTQEPGPSLYQFQGYLVTKKKKKANSKIYVI